MLSAEQEELREHVQQLVEELLDDVVRHPHDPYSCDDDDTVAVCLICDDVEGHRDGCPVPTVQAWRRKLKKGELY